MRSESSAPVLLVADDEPSVIELVKRLAVKMEFEVVSCTSGAEALARVGEINPDGALLDLRMPGISGIDVLRALRESAPECKVILMTGAGSVDTAIEAIKLGALDYITKPLDLGRVREHLVTIRENIARRERLLEADAEIARKFEFHGMVGRSPNMQELFDQIRRLAPHVQTVLITGETGTGKELVARAFHKLGTRRDKRFVTVNCSAVVETLFESELFGHTRGAFTGATETKVGMFEHADGGTLFLDEAGELPLTLQAKLLRAVEYGEVQRVGSLERRKVDVRVIAATNRDLRAESDAGRFRPDLFYRLSIIEVHIAPLRERREDVPYLTASIVRQTAERLKRPITGVTPSAERMLQQAPWPGNVRELRNVVERACILSENRVLSERDVERAMSSSARPRPGAAAVSVAASAEDSNLLSAAQRERIERVLEQVGGNKKAAAKLLGISRRSLYRWIDRLSIDQ